LLSKFVVDNEAPVTVMITGCITHKPNKVIIKKYAKCLPLTASFDLKVNFLLAKKLKTSAVDVDTKLLAIVGSPRATKVNNIPKSIEVLMMPTRPKRNLSACFFSSFFTDIAFFDKIKWATFRFFENSTDILPNYPQ